MLLRIDFKRWARDHTWFGWHCIFVMRDADGTTTARWARDELPEWRNIPVRRNCFPPSQYEENNELTSNGSKTYVPVPRGEL